MPPPAPLQYPPARRADTVDDYFGTKVADPYRWLEELDSEETRAWVKAQNELSAPILKALPQRAALRERLTELWSYERYGVPQRTRTGALLYTYHDGKKNHPELRVEDQPGHVPRVLIDPNAWSADGTAALVDWSVSPDGRYVLYARQTAGSDWIEYFLRDIATGADLPDRIERVNFNFDASRISWHGGRRGFFYSRFPDAPPGVAGTPAEVTNQKVYYHRVGTPQSEDVLVYEQPRQPHGFAFADTTADGRYLIVYVERTEDSEKEVYVKDLGDPEHPRHSARLRRLIDGFDARWALVGSRGSVLYFRTTDRAPRQRIVAIDLRRPSEKHWREVVPQNEDAMQDAVLLGGELIVTYLHHAASRLQRYALDGKPLGAIAPPGFATAQSGTGRPRATPAAYLTHWTPTGLPESSEIFYAFTSFAQPLAIYRHDLRTGQSEVVKPSKLAFRPDDYVTEQVFLASRDGTRVPMFITRRKDVARNGSARVLLYGYGGFANSVTPSFSVPNLVWMERGGIYAAVNLRGGAEYGDAWHRAGTLERKQNVFDDFIAAAEFLQRERYAPPGRLAIRGRSNGGLLMGAVVNQRPELFAAVHNGVGVLDMLRYHRFGIAHAWAGDYGTSATRAGFRYLSAYSPVHNVRPGTHYPAVLVTTADHDDRVHPLHSFKYTAAMQAAQAGEKPILIRIETQAGHGAGTGLSKLIEENADVLAFLEHHTAGK